MVAPFLEVLAKWFMITKLLLRYLNTGGRWGGGLQMIDAEAAREPSLKVS